MKYVPAPVPPKNSPQESRNSSLREGRGGRDYTKPKDSGRLEELRSSERRSSEKEVLRRGSGEDRRRGSERDERVEGRGSLSEDRRGSGKNEEQERRGSGMNENEGSGRRSVWVNSNRYMGSEEVLTGADIWDQRSIDRGGYMGSEEVLTGADIWDQRRY